ncbi:MAG TPA: GNAT family N-acetyltransferase, partial [Thermoanaerobaculia bacterium]|nr:GNAT family N-acetyltransferase [Thermoanaerobaculia bacterium]
LLDGWRLDDGWRGRDFFRRYLEDDPTFRDRNVWVAADRGELVSCVQIFPRQVLLRGRAVPLAGIGSVFTRAGRRREGLASTLLERALEAAAERGMEIALLYAARVGWYERRGWRSLPHVPTRIEPPRRRASLDAGDPFRIQTVDGSEIGELDLGAVARLHARFGAVLDGPLRRSRHAWRWSLRLAGNPRERFLLAWHAGRLAAYARATVLGGRRTVTEWAWEPDQERALAALLVRAGALSWERLLPVARGTIRRRRRRSTALRAPAVHGDGLVQALRDSGLRLVRRPERGLMARCLDPAALAVRLGVERRRGENGSELLLRSVRAERLCCWLSDRF